MFPSSSLNVWRLSLSATFFILSHVESTGHIEMMPGCLLSLSFQLLLWLHFIPPSYSKHTFLGTSCYFSSLLFLLYFPSPCHLAWIFLLTFSASLNLSSTASNLHIYLPIELFCLLHFSILKLCNSFLLFFKNLVFSKLKHCKHRYYNSYVW